MAGFVFCIVITDKICYNIQRNVSVVKIVDFRKKKMIAPIIITVMMTLYYVVYFGFLISLLNGIWKYVLGIIPLVFSGITIYVCVQRINEIKKGEEDDISKY